MPRDGDRRSRRHRGTERRAFSALTPGTGTRAAQVLSPLIAAQLQSYLHDTVERFVSSSAFATAWTTANRAAHATLDRLLAGDTGIVAIDLAPMVARIRQRLIDDGFTAAEQIPAIHHQSSCGSPTHCAALNARCPH